MAFKNATFIRPNVRFSCEASPAPMFRKVFSYDKKIENASLSVCALGFGYVYINGKRISDDLFTAPYGDYRKTLWYLTYNVKDLIKEGDNVISVICGNGWYNENMRSTWLHYEAEWRDFPKVILELSINGKNEVNTDKSWKYSMNSPVTYNELRSGEHYDSRLYDENWNRITFDDSKWELVEVDPNPPKGTFRLCECEPIRECKMYAPKKMYNISENKVVFDFGQNMSGYVRLHTNQQSGDKIIMRHMEEFQGDLMVGDNLANDTFFSYHYPDTSFQENEFICCGKEFVYTPMFTYHGFRFVEVTGLKKPSLSNVTGVFVHQDVERRSQFECSDDLLNSLFNAGIMATWSNMFYALTDCPTREKLGWMNDAQASTEQIMTNFKSEKFFKKWIQDIFDAMRNDGALPGIVPTPNWGYEDFNGPVADGALFEIPYRVYRHTGDDSLLKEGYPYFVRYLKHLTSLAEENGDICYGLGDWAAPSEDGLDSVFPNRMLAIKFMRIKRLAEERLGMDTSTTDKDIKVAVEKAKERYLTSDGCCSINKQTAVAMMIYFDIYDELEPLKKQLVEMIEKADFHHDCGMLGIRYFYHALSKCGLSDLAFRVVMAYGMPSYRKWMERGMTTMFEYWDCRASKNHHMLSDILSWMIKHILGIKQAKDSAGFNYVEIAPKFFEGLNYAKGYVDTINGKVAVSWEKAEMKIKVSIDIPENMDALYKDKLLKCGHYDFEE